MFKCSVIIVAFLLFAFNSLAQKQDVQYQEETHLVLVDNKPCFKLEKVDCGFGAVDCHFDVFDLTGKKVLRINLRDFNSPVEVSQSNPKGRVVYYEFIFLDSKQKTELDFMGMKSEKLAKSLVKYQLFTDGVLNSKSVDEFVLSHGTPYAERIKF